MTPVDIGQFLKAPSAQINPMIGGARNAKLNLGAAAWFGSVELLASEVNLVSSASRLNLFQGGLVTLRSGLLV
jgi:hypothetical protein